MLPLLEKNTKQNKTCPQQKHYLTLSSIYTHFNTLRNKVLGKHCGKR